MRGSTGSVQLQPSHAPGRLVPGERRSTASARKQRQEEKTGRGLTGVVVLALSIFWVVVMTLENSQMAGRNFSCRSQMLQRRSVVEAACGHVQREEAVQERGARWTGAVSTWRGRGGRGSRLTQSAGSGSHGRGLEANED